MDRQVRKSTPIQKSRPKVIPEKKVIESLSDETSERGILEESSGTSDVVFN